jgi:site-specific DNA-methyltransferase (adenine-specific)
MGVEEEKVNVHFSSQSIHWATPRGLYAELDSEFHFDFDPCPYQHEPAPLFGNSDGLAEPWGKKTFCNPPYGRVIGDWIRKGYEESRKAKTVVMLIPSRTDTQWWHEYVMKADEIRFIKGRLKFGDAVTNAPFPSCVVVFRGRDSHPACGNLALVERDKPSEL